MADLISRAAVLDILNTPEAQDTFPDMIRRVEALEGGVRVKPPFHFERYINGILMAEGVTVERQPDLPSAMKVAARIASRGPHGEVPVLVYAAALSAPTDDVSGGEIKRLREAFISDRTELLWNAYHTGHEANGMWDHCCMSDGEWLVSECGLDVTQRVYSAQGIMDRIPEAAARAAALAAAPAQNGGDA